MTEQPPPGCSAPPDSQEPAQALGPLPAATFVLDAGGRPRHANRVAQDLLGKVPDRSLTPDGPAEAHGAREAGTGRPYPTDRLPPVRALRGETSTVDDPEIHSQGEVTPIEVWAAPPVGDHGAPGLAAALPDGTARLRADAERVAGAAIVESSEDAIVGFLLDRAITTWNPAAARIYGYAADEAVGMDVSVLVPAERRDELADSIRRLQRGERLDHLETVHLRRDGARFPVSLSLWPVRDSRDGVAGATAIAHDLTDRRQALGQAGLAVLHQEQLAEVGKAVAGVAHDFNNVLSAVRLYADLIGSHQVLDAAGRQQIGAIEGQLDRGASLVWQMLDFCHRRPLVRTAVDVVAFLHDLMPVVRRALPADVGVAVHHDGGRHLAWADAARLQQVVLNLVTNAGDAIEGAGEVDITVSHDTAAVPPGIRIEVSDTGCGLTDEVCRRAFDAFFTTKPLGLGTGLGLAQVRALVTQHGGWVKIEEAPVAGTTVTVWLPEPPAGDDDAGGHVPVPGSGTVTGGVPLTSATWPTTS